MIDSGQPSLIPFSESRRLERTLVKVQVQDEVQDCLPFSQQRQEQNSSLLGNNDRAKIGLPFRGLISKRKMRKAFDDTDVLLVIPYLQGDDDVFDEPATTFYSYPSGAIVMTEKIINESLIQSISSAEKPPASPPCSPRPTPVTMTTPQDQGPVKATITDTSELSRFDNLTLQSHSCFSAFTSGKSRSSRKEISLCIPKQSQRFEPILFVGLDRSSASSKFAKRNQYIPLDSPGNSTLAIPKSNLTPRTTDKNRSKALLLSPHFSSELPCHEMQTPIAFVDLGKIEKDAVCNHQSLLSSSNARDDFAFVFNNDASHGSLTDDEGDEGDCFFLCEPKKDSYQHFMRAEHSTFPSPYGVDGTRSSVNTGRVPNSTASAGEQGISIAPMSMYSSCNSLFGMGFVHEDSQTSLDDMEICSFRLNPRLSKAVDSIDAA